MAFFRHGPDLRAVRSGSEAVPLRVGRRILTLPKG